MSLINKIELSNFLDKSGGKDWTPTYRHNVLNLLGQNTAIVLMNGSGKTTIATAFLAVLSRRKSLVSTMRTVFSPSNFGVYTHFRIEFIQPDMKTSIPTLPTIGTTVTGETYVFGVCGHKDDKKSLKFYCYPGTLDDVPVVEYNENSTDLLLNKEFENRIRAKNGSRYSNITVDEWLDRVHDHCGAQQLNQMVAFLKDGGGDKSASLYNTKVARGRKFHECFFYTHIAPQLTIGEATNDSEKGEIFLDDTIVNYSLNIVDAQIAGEKKEERLKRKRKATQVFLDIKQLRDEIIIAEKHYNNAYRKIAEVAAALKHLVIDNPLPGIPVITTGENDVVLNLIKNIVIVPDPDEPFLIKDTGLAGLLDRETKVLNQSFSRRSIKPENMAEHIDITCDLALPESYGGHKSKLYSLKNALKFIDVVDVEYVKKGGSETDRETRKELIQSAFKTFKTKCDTNPIRAKANIVFTEVRTVKETIDSLNDDLKKLEEEKVALEENLQLFQTNKIAFEKMRDSSLFTKDELDDPEKTRQSLKVDAESLEQSKKEAENKVRSSHAHYELYQSFHSEFPMESPDKHLQFIEKEEQRLSDLLHKKEVSRDNAGVELSKVETALKNVEAELRNTNKEYEKIAVVQPGYLTFKDSFEDEDPIGYETRIREKGSALRDEITRRKSILEEAEKGYEVELEFYNRMGEVDPSQWLSEIDEERSVLFEKQAELKKSISQFEGELKLLRQNKVAPGVNASKSLRLIPKDIAYQSLYSFIKEYSPSQKQAEQFLTLFSSLLFAPVVSTNKDISSLLDIYSNTGEDVLLPVFHADSLTEFLNKEEPVIQISEDNVAYLIAGKSNSLIECILDPEKVEKRRSLVEVKLESCEKALRKTRERISEISSNSEIVTLAQKAKNSKDKQLRLKVARVTGELEALKKEQIAHTHRFTEEVIKSIKAAEKFLILGGPGVFTRLYDQQVLQQKTYDDLVLKTNELKQRYAKYRQEFDEIRNEFSDHKDKNWEKKKNLSIVKSFLPEGLEAYKNAEFHIFQAEQRLTVIRNKQDYDLSRAAGYVSSLKINNESDLQAQFKRIDTQRDAKNLAVSQQKQRLNQLKGDLRQYKKHSQEYDRFLIFINDLFKKALRNIQRIKEDDVIDIDRVVSLSSDLRVSLQQSSFDFSNVHDKYELILGLLQKDNFDVLNNKVSSARNRVRESEDKFDTRCTREAKSLKKDSVLNTEEINLIKEIKETPEKINHWAKLFEDSLHTEEDDLSKGREHEEKLRSTLASNLTALTDKATGNLRILKQVLKETGDSASYKIDCEIANRESIEGSIDEMVEMVKTAHQEYHSKKNDPYRTVNKSEEDEHKKSLKERVSEKCYRSIFLKPLITYKHPDIRGGHTTPFNIDKNYKGISEGEKTSLALLMQVVMARYSQKRKFLEEIGQGIRKRRDAAEAPNVLLIDGLFSSLSKPSLINQAFKSIKSTQGAFQIIGLIHNTTYVSSHDFEVFPNLFVGRTYTNGGSDDDNDGWVAFEHRQKEMIGQMAFANFQATKKQ